MFMRRSILYARSIRLVSAAAVLLAAGQAMAELQIDWHTIDCGGVMDSAGGTFALSGTIGQPDAGPVSGPMTGGSFSLIGGLWPGAAASCPLPGDMNGDSLRNGRDIQHFVNCLTAGGSCFCADTDLSGAANAADIASFVAFLMS